MVARTSVLARVVRVGHPVVPDDAAPVYGGPVLLTQVRRELGRESVRGVREPGRVIYEALVLYADRGLVVGPVARVPSAMSFSWTDWPMKPSEERTV